MCLHIIFCGNPGAGKSTLLNCLIGRLIFQSGVSAVTGLTTDLQTHVIDGKKYSDTPGLDDIASRVQAAVAITAGLKQDGDYQIVFIITTENGRLRPADIVTIEIILAALPVDVPYGVVVNQLPAELFAALDSPFRAGDRDSLRESYMTRINAGHRPTPYICFVKSEAELAGKNNVVIQPPRELEAFLRVLPRVVIRSQTVKDIDPTTFQERVEAANRTIAELTDSFDKRMAERDAQVAQMNSQIAGLQRALDEAQNDSGLFGFIGGLFKFAVGTIVTGNPVAGAAMAGL